MHSTVIFDAITIILPDSAHTTGVQLICLTQHLSSANSFHKLLIVLQIKLQDYSWLGPGLASDSISLPHTAILFYISSG